MYGCKKSMSQPEDGLIELYAFKTVRLTMQDAPGLVSLDVELLQQASSVLQAEITRRTLRRCSILKLPTSLGLQTENTRKRQHHAVAKVRF